LGPNGVVCFGNVQEYGHGSSLLAEVLFDVGLQLGYVVGSAAASPESCLFFVYQAFVFQEPLNAVGEDTFHDFA
jgi:hypothetical protein